MYGMMTAAFHEVTEVGGCVRMREEERKKVIIELVKCCCGLVGICRYGDESNISK